VSGVMMAFWMLLAIVGPPVATGEHLYNTKDWGALTTDGVGPNSKYDVYIKASGSGVTCSFRTAISGNTYYLVRSTGHYAMVRIDWYVDAPGSNDQGVVNLNFFGGEAYQVNIGGTAAGRLKAERISGGVGQSYSYTITAIGQDWGSNTCSATTQGTFSWT